MKYLSFLDIFGFDQSSAIGFVGNWVKVVYSEYLAFSIECTDIFHFGTTTDRILPQFCFFSVFPSVSFSLYTVCSNFKHWPCVGFLFHSLPVLLNIIINRNVFKMSILKFSSNILIRLSLGWRVCHSGFLSVCMLGDIALTFGDICKAVFLTDIARNAFLFKAHFECHVKSRNYTKLYGICSWVR